MESYINNSNRSSDNNTSESDLGDSFDNLYPALIECFGIIILGYITGRLGSISTTEVKGLSKFAINTCLPAFIFRAIVTLDFSRITWMFVFVVTLAKLLLFAGVAILTLLFTRDIGKAGLYGLFCTMSNDLALGIPLLKTMYEDSHEEFIYCIYFLVLVSLVLFLPLALLMMEFSKHRSEHTTSSFGHAVLKTLKAVIINPVVLGSISGIPFNFILNQDIPRALDKFLETLSNAFPAAALFYLGLSVVGKIKAQIGMVILVPLSLTVAKVLILPLMVRALLTSFIVGGSKMNEQWSIFGFIYGSIPTAPTVVMYAGACGMQEDMVASGMVMATLFSAPVMFSSSKMASVHNMNYTYIEYKSTLVNTRNDISFVAIAMACWVIIILLFSRRYKVAPHNHTIWLATTQLCLCISFVLTKSQSFIDNCKRLECFLVTTFLLATHCRTALLAFYLACIRCSRNVNTFSTKFGMYFFGWGFPICCSSIVLIVLESHWKNFSKGELDFILYLQEQTVFTAFWVAVQCICVLICIASLVWIHRCDVYSCKCKMTKRRNGINEETPLLTDEQSEECHRCKNLNDCSSSGESEPLTTECGLTDIEDIEVTFLRSMEDRSESDAIENEKMKLEKYYEGEKHQCGRHVIVITCHMLVMIVCIFYGMWILVKDKQKSGIFLEVQLLVFIVLSCQVLIVFVLFGFERALIIDPFLQRVRRYWYGVDEVILPKLDDLPPDEYHICEQFVRHHKVNCVRALTGDGTSSLDRSSLSINSEHRNNHVFLGSELVDWLLEVGLVADRMTAVHYGKSLLRGRVICHSEKRHYFTDTELLYEFCPGWENNGDGEEH